MEAQVERKLLLEDMEPTEGRRWPKRLLWLAIVVLVLGGGFFAWQKFGPGGGSEGKGDDKAAAAGTAAAVSSDKDKKGKEGEEKEKAPIPVSVAQVSQGAISSYLSATANLIPEDQVKVLAEAEGRVVSLTVEEGDTVRKGQVLASLAREDALIAVQKAEVKVKNTGLAHERGTRMHKDQLLAAEAYDKLTMEHNIAREELAEARWRLSKTTIHAPFDGRLTVRSVRIGQHIRRGDELFTVADFEPLVAYVFFPERDVLGLDSGKPVRITLKADEKVQFQGRIRQVSPVVDPATGTVKVTVEAIQVPKEVRPGGFVTVDVVRETRPGAVLVPRTAILRELATAHVFVAKDGVAQKRDVSLGLEEGDFVEATAGLAAGEQVIVAGHGALREGAKISILETDVKPAERPADARPGR
jgi:membrane fusion protein (multidrug efflux system)